MSCHHSQNHPDISVHFRDICFPYTSSTFKPRNDSHHGDTWDSPVESLVGKLHLKAWREIHRPLDPGKGMVTLLLQRGRKSHVHAPTPDED